MEAAFGLHAHNLSSALPEPLRRHSIIPRESIPGRTLPPISSILSIMNNQRGLAVDIPRRPTIPSLEPHPTSGSSPYGYTSEAFNLTTPSSDTSLRRVSIFDIRTRSDLYPPGYDAQLLRAQEEVDRRANEMTQEDREAAGQLLDLRTPTSGPVSGSSGSSFPWNNPLNASSSFTHHVARRSIEEEVSPTSGVRGVAKPDTQSWTTVEPLVKVQTRPSVVFDSTRINIQPRAVSAVNSADNETPGVSDLRCAFEEPGAAEPCLMDQTARKCTSEKFGRNKACTKKLAPHWWNYSCRKHYQRKKYEASHNGRFPQYQRECIINQINKFLTFAHSFEFDIKWQLNLGATIEEYHHMLRMGHLPEHALQDITVRHGASLSSRTPIRQAAMDKFKAELDMAVKVNHLCGDNKTVIEVFAFLERMYSLCQQHSDIKDLELPHIEFLPKRWVLRAESNATFTRPSQPASFPGRPSLRPSDTQGAEQIRRASDPDVEPKMRSLPLPTRQSPAALPRRESEVYTPLLVRRDTDFASPPPPTGQGMLLPSASSWMTPQHASSRSESSWGTPYAYDRESSFVVPQPSSRPTFSSLMPPPSARPISRRSPGLQRLQTDLGTGVGPIRTRDTAEVKFSRYGAPYPPRM